MLYIVISFISYKIVSKSKVMINSQSLTHTTYDDTETRLNILSKKFLYKRICYFSLSSFSQS